SEGEMDAMGLLHDDFSGDSSAGGMDSLIDNRRYDSNSGTPLLQRQQQQQQQQSQSVNDAISSRKPKSKLNKVVASSTAPVISNSPPSKEYSMSQSRSKSYGSVDNFDIDPRDDNRKTKRPNSKYIPTSPSKKYRSENPFEYDFSSSISKSPTLRLDSIRKSASTSDSGSENEEDSVYASSNPSSRRSSNVSSLNDVCFPIGSLDDTGKRKMWPDIGVLEEFAQEEISQLKKLNEASVALSRSSSYAASTLDPTDSGGVGFQYPIVSGIDSGDDNVNEPFLVSTEDETDLFNGRLRPQKPTPWNTRTRSGTPEVFPGFQDRQSKQEKFRFTYFRENLDDTIHSPNISGLLSDGMTFADLFVSSHYSQKQNNTTPSNDNDSMLGSSANLHSSQASVKARVASTGTTTPTPSIMADSQSTQAVAPFWVDVLNPTEEEMKVLSKAFGIHPLTTEDIFLGETREKVELFKDYYLVCFTSFDVVQQHHNRKKALEKAYQQADLENSNKESKAWFRKVLDLFFQNQNSQNQDYDRSGSTPGPLKKTSSVSIVSKKTKRKKKKTKDGDLEPLNMYIIVFRDGVITFHFKPTPHSGNVRRRARLLRDYLTVSSDWIGYALIDDITDAYAPLIESIEDEVNAIEDAILIMQSGATSDDESDDSSDESDDEGKDEIWFKLKRRNSNVAGDRASLSSRASRSTSSSTASGQTKILSWKRKGDMLRRIGDCRKRVMSLLRLLGFKADVIKGFSKRCNEQWDVAPRSEIGMYLGDIQDHIVTMVQSLNHYEKLLARSHSNYLAQINIDMTKVNNDMNDILGKITIMGTIVLPMNIVTGLWGMNCLVPGQDTEGLTWFWGIVMGMMFFALLAYYYAKKISGIM
ncbi:hypothetical protein CANARDRAFT_187438, partial [[Candida] arabinofermentans NRRL YB-2248]